MNEKGLAKDFFTRAIQVDDFIDLVRGKEIVFFGETHFNRFCQAFQVRLMESLTDEEGLKVLHEGLPLEADHWNQASRRNWLEKQCGVEVKNLPGAVSFHVLDRESMNFPGISPDPQQHYRNREDHFKERISRLDGKRLVVTGRNHLRFYFGVQYAFPKDRYAVILYQNSDWILANPMNPNYFFC